MEGELKLTIFELEVVVMRGPSLVVSDDSPALEGFWIYPGRNCVLSYQLVELGRLDFNSIVLSIEVKIAWSINVILSGL